MAERTIQTNMVVTGAEEYISTVGKVTAAPREACKAKKEFDVLFGKAPDSTES